MFRWPFTAAARRRPQTRSFSPILESLEDRLTPANPTTDLSTFMQDGQLHQQYQQLLQQLPASEAAYYQQFQGFVNQNRELLKQEIQNIQQRLQDIHDQNLPGQILTPQMQLYENNLLQQGGGAWNQEAYQEQLGWQQYQNQMAAAQQYGAQLWQADANVLQDQWNVEANDPVLMAWLAEAANPAPATPTTSYYDTPTTSYYDTPTTSYYDTPTTSYYDPGYTDTSDVGTLTYDESAPSQSITYSDL